MLHDDTSIDDILPRDIKKERMENEENNGTINGKLFIYIIMPL